MMGFALVQTAGTSHRNQTVSLAVNAVYKIATSGNPGGLTITTGTAGTNALSTVSDNTSTYSITQNVAGTVKVTANLDAALSAGYTLQLNLASSKGTSAGTVDISNTTPGAAVNVVTGICDGCGCKPDSHLHVRCGCLRRNAFLDEQGRYADADQLRFRDVLTVYVSGSVHSTTNSRLQT